jgi:hypothetical protein
MRGACWITKATHTHTHTLCNAYCFSTATKVTRTRLSVTLHVHCLSCSCFLTTTPDHHTLIFNVRYTWPTSILKLFHNTGAVHLRTTQYRRLPFYVTQSRRPKDIHPAHKSITTRLALYRTTFLYLVFHISLQA